MADKSSAHALRLHAASSSVVEAVSGIKADTDEIQGLFDGLSEAEREALLSDAEVLKRLCDTLLQSIALPATFYAARLEDGTLVGYIALKGEGLSTPELQIEVMAEHRRKGYGRAMLSLLTDKVFRETTAAALICRIRANNTASIRLVESVGGKRQAPASEAEGLLLRTYRIEKMTES